MSENVLILSKTDYHLCHLQEVFNWMGQKPENHRLKMLETQQGKLLIL